MIEWHIFGCAPDSWWKYTMWAQSKAGGYTQPISIINRSQLFIIITVHTSYYSVKTNSVLLYKVQYIFTIISQKISSFFSPSSEKIGSKFMTDRQSHKNLTQYTVTLVYRGMCGFFGEICYLSTLFNHRCIKLLKC